MNCTARQRAVFLRIHTSDSICCTRLTNWRWQKWPCWQRCFQFSRIPFSYGITHPGSAFASIRGMHAVSVGAIWYGFGITVSWHSVFRRKFQPLASSLFCVSMPGPAGVDHKYKIPASFSPNGGDFVLKDVVSQVSNDGFILTLNSTLFCRILSNTVIFWTWTFYIPIKLLFFNF